MSRANWADTIKGELRDALDHVLAIPCTDDEGKRCHRCEAGLLLACSLGYAYPQAYSIVTGETTVTRLEVARLRMEYAAALQRETYDYEKAAHGGAGVRAGEGANGGLPLPGSLEAR